MEFQDWLWNKFLEWESNQPEKHKSYSDFARYLGIKVNTFTQWRVGNNRPSLEMATLLAKKLGSEVYGVLGFAGPDILADFPWVRVALENSVSRIEAEGLSPNSSEAKAIFTQELSRVLSSLSSNTIDDESAK